MKRRSFLQALPLTAAGLSVAQAQDAFPSKPIRMVVAFAAGGPADIFARVFAQPFGEALGQPVVIDNRSGGGGAVGSQAVIAAPADGYTLIFHSSSSAVYSAITREPHPFDPVKAFDPVALVGISPFVLAVGPNVKAATLAQLVEQAKRNPGAMSYGSAGTGSSIHVVGELFKQRAGNLQITHVPYRGSGPAINDTMAGTVDFTIDTYSTLLQNHRSGRMRILAVLADKRSAVAPEIPTAREQGIDVAGYTYNLVSAPARTPADRIERLAAAAQKVMNTPAMLAKVREMGIEPVIDSGPRQTREFIAREVATFTPVIKAAKIVAE